MQYGPKIVTDSLVLALDAADNNSYSGSGTTWYDLTANNNNFTLTNTPTHSTTNKGYFDFDGTDQYALMTNSTQLASLTTNFTAEAFIKFDSSGGQYAIFSKGSSFVQGWVLYVRQGPQFSFIGYDSNNASTTTYTTASGGISTGTWYHVVYTYDQTSVKAYINGVLQFSTSLTVTFRNTDSTCYVGYNGGIGTPRYWDGNIALVRIYSKALSSTEVLQNYNATKSRYNL